MNTHRFLPPRWFPWFLVGLYVILSGVGMYLQALSDTYLSELSFPLLVFSFVAYGFYMVNGALIASRLPRNPVGWLICLVPLVTTIDFITFGYAYYGLVAHPGSLPGADILVIWLTFVGRPFGVLSLTLLILLFPDGRPLSHRWRVVGWVATGAFALFLLLAVLKPGPIKFFPFVENPVAVGETVWAILNPLNGVVGIVVLLSVVAALVSLFLRLRRARGDERQQIKWIIYTFASTVVFFLFITTLGSELGLQTRVILPVLFFFQTLISFVMAIAILKFRLYDIDIIIRKTLVYGALTALLGLVYFSGIVILQGILDPLTGEFNSPLVTVITTLGTAALFNPFRIRVQSFIDRRFYRKKFDAEQTLAAFAATARDEVELERLTGELLAVVEETMQLEHVSLWLAEPEHHTLTWDDR